MIKVHMMQTERDAALAQKTWLDRQRFRPQQWSSSRHRWQAYGVNAGEPWYGFNCVRALRGLPPEILLVPLLGHTLGHAGVAIRKAGGWTLLAGDAYFYHREMDSRPWCTPGLRFYQTMMEKDRKARLHNQARLRGLVQRFASEIDVFSAHDPLEFERASGRPAGMPAPLEHREAPAY